MREPQDKGEEHTEDAPRVAEPESFGTWLRRQREVREIDLREIADSSKVSMSYLRAFEEDRFDVLPAPLFAKGFLRQYARYVGLDPEEVVNFYLAAHQPEAEEVSLQPHTEPEPPSRKYLFFALALTAALVLLVWLLSLVGDRPLWPKSSPVPASSPSTTEAPPTSTGSSLATPPPSTANSQAEAPAVEPAASPKELEDPQIPATPLAPIRVTLDFLSDCWVEASVDGEERLSELKVQGESLLLDAEEVVDFKVGDVEAVQVEVNGVPFEIANRSGTSVRNVRIDLAALAVIQGAETPAPVAPESASSKPDSEPSAAELLNSGDPSSGASLETQEAGNGP